MSTYDELTDEERAEFRAWSAEQDAKRVALERECRIDVYSDAVPNGRSKAVVTHVPTGTQAECGKFVTQLSNKSIALERLGMKLGRISSNGTYL